jgi:hypothetical protein
MMRTILQFGSNDRSYDYKRYGGICFYEPTPVPRERERDTKKEVVGFLFSAFASGARVALRAQIERERERSERLFGDDD